MSTVTSLVHPGLVPQPTLVHVSEGTWVPTAGRQIHVDGSSPQMSSLAHQFATEIRRLSGRELVVAPHGRVETAMPEAGDVVLVVAAVGEGDAVEAYSLSAATGALVITGGSAAGVFAATRTALQLLGADGEIAFEVFDWPACERRGLHLDIARKHFTREWIERLIRELAFLKMNALQLHISDGLGFRVASEKHPEIVSPAHLTADDIERIRAVAADHHVTLIPSVDTPAHMDWILTQHPEWQLRLSDGTILTSHLDYSIPEARRFVADLVTEMIELFDSPLVHLGGDEFFPAPWHQSDHPHVSPSTAPQLVDFARSRGGIVATIVDGFIAYLNEIAEAAAGAGATGIVWNDDIPVSSLLSLAPSVEIGCWVRWNPSMPTPDDYADAGHRLVNANGDYLYFILEEQGLGTGPTKHPRGIYEGWSPVTFMGLAGNRGDYRLSDRYALAGAQLSVWCDHPDVMSEAEIRTELSRWMTAFSEKAWGAHASRDYEHFSRDAARVRALSERLCS